MSGTMSRFLLATSILLLPALSLVIYPEAEIFAQAHTSPAQADVVDTAFGTSAEDDSSDTPLPVVIWHGLGDSSQAEGIKDIAEIVNDVYPGTYVHIISLVDGGGDRQQSWFGNVNDQVDFVCDQLARDHILSTAPAIDAIGFSQGGQFLRAYIERCANEAPKVRSLITFGSQHNGIAEFEKCGSGDFFCHTANIVLKSRAVWNNWVQTHLVPAQYYRDTKDFDNYLGYSNFLADINNEGLAKEQRYADNLAQLENFVMVVFEDDKTVVPKESGWFAEVDPDTANVTLLRERQIYKEDWLGLKKLDEKQGLVFESVKGEHMQLEEEDLKRFFKSYFGPAKAKKEKNTEKLEL